MASLHTCKRCSCAGVVSASCDPIPACKRDLCQPSRESADRLTLPSPMLAILPEPRKRVDKGQERQVAPGEIVLDQGDSEHGVLVVSDGTHQTGNLRLVQF